MAIVLASPSAAVTEANTRTVLLILYYLSLVGRRKKGGNPSAPLRNRKTERTGATWFLLSPRSSCPSFVRCFTRERAPCPRPITVALASLDPTTKFLR